MFTPTHGMSNTSTYHAWEHMLHRCDNANNPQFKDYGARGVGVCDKWRTFEGFFADMGDCPPGLTLERVDNDGSYGPGNCRWATRKEQARNRRDNRHITFRGETLCAVEWAERFGMKKDTFMRRLRLGWLMEDIASTPVSRHNTKKRNRQII